MLNYTFYDRRRLGKAVFFLASITAIIVFLFVSNNLVKGLGRQESQRMKIWADATKRLVQQDSNTDIEFLFSIIEQNDNIPVLIADEQGNILDQRNFDLPDSRHEKKMYTDLSDRDRDYLSSRLKRAIGASSLREAASRNPHIIAIDVAGTPQYIYFEDSDLLHRLSWYPYIQMGVMIFLAVIVFITIVYTKRAEQNRVWVGLSKETAHQLGTPISSLMAWTELLGSYGVDKSVVEEINKDVKRLSTIAERFSKIGSVPELDLEYLNETIDKSLAYMRSRVSGKVELRLNLSDDDHGAMLSRSLFEWVMENLVKNAVDAMGGKPGTITITTGQERDRLYIDVRDTGKGIHKKNFKNVFNPGFTTKKRGWGLGLTLVKRIIEEYHKGRIYVKSSEPGVGTTFRIELPTAS